MERYVDMVSPITGGRVKEVIKKETHQFRGFAFEVNSAYYVCEDTGELFTESSQDILLFNELYSQYRLKTGIPFPEEIREIRERYGLNMTQMTKILGFGANQYARYEDGQVPSESNGKMLRSIESKEIMLNYLEMSRGEFSEDEYGRIRTKVLAAEPVSRNELEQQIFYGDTRRSILNGFSRFDCGKLKKMVAFFVAGEGEVFPTKLNKEMFYADFLHYRKYGRSISGLQYQALQFGPVPYHFATIYDNVEDINREYVFSHDHECLKLTCDNAGMSGFSEEELGILKTVLEKIRPMSTSKIVEESHKESAWQKYQADRSFIPYSEAYFLNLFN